MSNSKEKQVVYSPIKRTKKRGFNIPSSLIGTATSQGEKSGGFNWLRLALNNPYLPSKEVYKVVGELKGKVATNSKGQSFIVTAGRISPFNMWKQAKRWYIKFKLASKVFSQLTNHNYYRYLLTLNSPNFNATLLKEDTSKVIRVLKQNSKIGLIFRANGIAPTYRNGKPNMDYHVHFKLFTTKRINKRQLVRKIKKTLHNQKPDLNLKRINPKHDRTNSYLADQQLWFDHWNKQTHMTYGKTFLSFSIDEQMTIQAIMFDDCSRKFSMYTNAKNSAGKHVRPTLRTKPNQNLSLFSGSKYKSKPQTKVNRHHWTKLELWRNRNGLNIYTGQVLKRTYKHHRAFPAKYQKQLGLPNFKI